MVPAGSFRHTSPTADPRVSEGWSFVGGVVFRSAPGAVNTAALLGEVVEVLGEGLNPPRPPPRFPGEAGPCERVLRTSWELWGPFTPFRPFPDIIR